ncbi:MAG: peptidoglycan DD-metalloendopeptidase family protein [Candidatus Eisenbacteria bacterium]|nr:peptidoglycan DD-metalloendopeptidase family protein [Candidatus Eisenbacteria bacterium]
MSFLGFGRRDRKGSTGSGAGSQRSPRGDARHFTVTVTSGAGTRPRQLRVSVATARLVALLAVAGLIGIAVLVSTYGTMTRAALRTRAVEAENHRLRGQLARLVQLEERLEQMDRSRRSLLGVAGVALSDSVLLPASAPIEEGTVTGAAYRHARPDTTLAETELDALGELAWEIPLEGPLTREFGPVGAGQFHTGIDIAGETGAKVRAAAEGVVSFAGEDETFGVVLVIAHTARVSTMYGHNSRLLARVGDFVFAGQDVAEVGSTGQSSAPHLHLELHWDGAAIDPTLVFRQLETAL